ncbi:hypothetical protein DFQ27_002914 [Actinomortierella ambigua]|uniref:MAPEG family protein n=1 Tax=Actinomortierella ambigua TaxID=1343610 RepID=A0A9P6Q679_9FUNG|nr:hypothetical protein DFQ27_002914 [Actinomortierella ambigua]
MNAFASRPNFALASLPIAMGLVYLPFAGRLGLTVYNSKKWNNVNPRDHVERQKGNMSKEAFQLIKRLDAAHQNALEITPFYMAAVLAALYSGMDKGRVAQLSGLFIVSRTFYTAFYIFGVNEIIASARSLSFFACIYACGRLFAGAAHQSL